eukprot:1189369-Prorocentrum_minimum.AAC.1
MRRRRRSGGSLPRPGGARAPLRSPPGGGVRGCGVLIVRRDSHLQVPPSLGVRRGSEGGQKGVRRWSEGGQKMVRRWSVGGQKMVRRG